MKYTDLQASGKASQIWKRFAGLIHLACANSIVDEAFLAGFIGVEAGVERHSGQIDPSATRFEPGVYARLESVRDGLLRSYNGIHQADLGGADDAALRNLATSWGLTQIMGWHLIHNLAGTVADLRDPDKHLRYAVQLLVRTSRPYLQKKDFGSVLRIWNSGSANGKTYDPDYVHNALLVREKYAAIAAANKHAFSISPAVELPSPSPEVNIPPVNEPTVVPAVDPADQAQQPAPVTQQAENITNVQTGDKTVPDNFVPENKTVDAPAKENSTKNAAAVTVLGFAVPTFLAGFVTAIKDMLHDGTIDAKEVAGAVIQFLAANQKYVFAGLGLVVVGMMLKKFYKQVTLWLQMYFAARADMHNVTVKPQ